MMGKKNPVEEFHFEVKPHGFQLSAADCAGIERAVQTLKSSLARFPQKDLQCSIIYHPKRNDYHVKANLRLPSRTLFTGERSERVHEAMTACVDHLLRKLAALKEQLEEHPPRIAVERSIGPQLWSSTTFDAAATFAARERDDYRGFRASLDGFHAGLTDRLGRWLERFPEIEDELGETITISDLVEDVFFHAYENYSEKSSGVSMGIWLESLIDPTLKDYLRDGETEYANICYAQHMLEPSRA